MTSPLMKALPQTGAMTKTLRAASLAAGLCVWPALATSAGLPGPSPCDAPKAAAAWPTFCAIPPTPTDARSPEAFKAAVVSARQAGRRVVVASGPGTFGLPIGEADAFSAAARAEVTPPRPLPPPASAAARAADLAEALKEVTPPPRHRRPLPDTPVKP
jgi:hypothetical protein